MIYAEGKWELETTNSTGIIRKHNSEVTSELRAQPKGRKQRQLQTGKGG